LKSSEKAPKKKMDVILLKAIDGLGDAGDMVSVTQAMFENGLRRTGKARLPRAADLDARKADLDAASGANAA